MTAVDVIVPEGIDDPARPSGGNVYDRHVCQGLAQRGWVVREHDVPGAWPRAGAAGHDALARAVRPIPDGAVVLLDGLVASAAPEVLVPHARRLRQVVLVHMPLGHRPPDGEEGAVSWPERRSGAALSEIRAREGAVNRPERRSGAALSEIRAREGAVLAAAAAVVTTSAWARRRLRELYALPGDRVHVAAPGVDAAGLAPASTAGAALLCVAAVTPGKGHDVLLDALATARELPWRCACVGSLERDPGFAARVGRRARDLGLDERVAFPGPRTGPDLECAYATADLLVLASRAETYGMVVTEALARGVPVLATEVGGVPEALGVGRDGTRPGLLVAPDDPAAFGAALRAWLRDADLRARLRRAAHERRASLRPWAATTSVLAGVLADLEHPRRAAQDRAGDAVPRVGGRR